MGGNEQINPGSDGLDGGNTSIVVNGNTYSVSGGKGGKYEYDDTYVSNSGGLGGGIKTSNYSSSARYVNWMNSTLTNGGKNGNQGIYIQILNREQEVMEVLRIGKMEQFF